MRRRAGARAGSRPRPDPPGAARIHRAARGRNRARPGDPPIRRGGHGHDGGGGSAGSVRCIRPGPGSVGSVHRGRGAGGPSGLAGRSHPGRSESGRGTADRFPRTHRRSRHSATGQRRLPRGALARRIPALARPGAVRGRPGPGDRRQWRALSTRCQRSGRGRDAGTSGRARPRAGGVRPGPDERADRPGATRSGGGGLDSRFSSTGAAGRQRASPSRQLRGSGSLRAGPLQRPGPLDSEAGCHADGGAAHRGTRLGAVAGGGTAYSALAAVESGEAACDGARRRQPRLPTRPLRTQSVTGALVVCRRPPAHPGTGGERPSRHGLGGRDRTTLQSGGTSPCRSPRS